MSFKFALSDDSDTYKWSLIGKSWGGRSEREREKEKEKGEREYCNPGLSFVFVFAEWFVFASWLMVSLPSKMFPINLDIKNSSGQSQEFLLWHWTSHSCHVDISRNTARELGREGWKMLISEVRSLETCVNPQWLCWAPSALKGWFLTCGMADMSESRKRGCGWERYFLCIMVMASHLVCTHTHTHTLQESLHSYASTDQTAVRHYVSSKSILSMCVCSCECHCLLIMRRVPQDF